MTELVKWTSSAAVLLDFANIFGPMYLLHSLQVAIVMGKSKKNAATEKVYRPKMLAKSSETAAL